MKFIKGNILDALDDGCDYIAHVCNAQGVQASGVAKQIRAKYPDSFVAYYNVCKDAGSKRALGFSTHADDRVLCLIAQEYYWTEKRQIHYGHLIRALKHACENHIICTIGIPYPMGCGLAGGDWNTVKEILEAFESMYGVEFIVYEWEG
jgi:O-acetyl-ADP-ribose deacetylase (regulator of RNase III)